MHDPNWATVLIVSEDAATRAALCQSLALSKFEPLTVSSFDEARTFLSTATPAMLLLDPPSVGLRAPLRELVALADGPAIVVLARTDDHVTIAAELGVHAAGSGRGDGALCAALEAAFRREKPSTTL
jgi:DNA-binding response OmpR family regulator